MSEKKIAVVTGGARGIGKAIALELAKAGNFVVINYNGSEEKARETKAEIEAAGGQADILQCNVCLLYTSPSPRDKRQSRMPSSA